MRKVVAGAVANLALVALALAALGLYAAHRAFTTQCFSHIVPAFPNHGLSEVRDARPAGLDAAAALLELHLQRGEPLLLRDRSSMHGWDDEACWTPECLRRRFGTQPLDAPGQQASSSLSDWLDAFFDGGSRAPAGSTEAAGCFGRLAGRSHCTVDEGGAPFCAAPCFTNATINFGIHPFSESFNHWESALASTGWLALQRRRALKGESWAARLVTALFPSQYGFDPGVDWVEGVLWLSPKGARSGLHRDDEPCLVLHQLHGTKRVLLFSPDQSELLSPKPSTHSLAEHGTRYSTQPFPFDERPPAPAAGLEITLQAGDALLIPNGWWHAVEALSDSVSIGKLLRPSWHDPQPDLHLAVLCCAVLCCAVLCWPDLT